MPTVDPQSLAEVVGALQRTRDLLDQLVVRGVRTVGPAELDQLDALREELARAGAQHLAGRLRALGEAMRADDPQAAARLMQAHASLHLFDRVLTLRVAEQQLAEATVGGEEAGG